MALDPDGELAELANYVIVDDSAINGLAGPHIIFRGVNIHVQNGSAQTDVTNGLGNLIVGYNECGVLWDGPLLCDSSKRDGSHNMIIGPEHHYTSFGGLVAGLLNSILVPHATVSGGRENIVGIRDVGEVMPSIIEGFAASVSGGYQNEASHKYASVTGGMNNMALGAASSVSGGLHNMAHTNGSFNSVSGGAYNVAILKAASVCGGYANTAYNDYSTVSGGRENRTDHEYSTVSGGSGLSTTFKDEHIP